MKIAIVSPCTTITSIGVRIISAVLKKEGHQVELIFIPESLYGEESSKKDLIVSSKKNKKYSQATLALIMDLARGSDLVCISLNENFFGSAVEISEKIKKDLAVPIIFGGPHATINPRECLKYADFVCCGEGEGVIVELARKLGNKKKYSAIKNLCFKGENGNFIINPLRPLIQNLDTIPFQDYSFKNHHIIFDEKIYSVNKSYFKYFFNDKFKDNIYPIYVTRGCPMGCSYCFNSNFNKLYSGQNIFRRRSVDNVIDELVQIKKKLPFIKSVHIVDDNFLALDESYIEEFSEKYKKYVDLPFVTYGVHPNTVSRKKLGYLTDAGLSGIRMGIQSASERTKKLYKRHYSNFQIEEACKTINEFKDKIKLVHYDVILDNPWEKEEDLVKTLIFLNKIPLPHVFVLFSLTFFPGTELYDLAKKEGIIKKETEQIYEKCYWEMPPTYINKLFYLLSDYAIAGKKINPFIISILVNRFLRKIGFSVFVYRFVRMGAREIIELH